MIIGTTCIIIISYRQKEENMEKRDLKISFGKSGSGSISPKLSIPKSFLDKIGITQEEREIEIEVNEDTQEIIIRKKK